MTIRHATRLGLTVLVATVLFTASLAAQKVRIVQTNSAGDNVHLIDPATNKVAGIIEGSR
jgi:multisubunit Na+/H+ antiporter MnhF subunit